ncbi:MAG: pyridoxamine 5'-phosphate oxidase family protein [Caldilineaceae bacterium]|nr:pyridoxamine 5'-phosphate oxidase family protein [Caldilineaceae bacterium]MBP8109220.1 pyridoxamine 5'-phosphate oxidase family protein [Caldilineaceae bacterium]MBP8122727.1 pyridoxamine 5'-phosphate oxidase family protein [Caldilineaceae bacterium]MBP9072197.1 pyridoxamine 5'-phosphate oxidase family protein [Caldilineaceae bacterium]
MTHDLIPSRPHMPGYGIQDAEDGAGLLPWSHVDERMAAARNYWIGSTRPDGRPHAAPVWGVWLDDAFYFGVGGASRKGRNMVHQPYIVVHLESGDDTVILEGSVERVMERAKLEAINAVYGPKYAFYPLGEAGDQPYDEPFYCLRPQVVFAWLESDFPNTATRWTRPKTEA